MNMNDNLKERLKMALDVIDNMSIEEFEQSLIKVGYYPKRKHPSKIQLEIEQKLTYNNLSDLFLTLEDGELRDEVRKSILSMRRVAELMSMLGMDI